jgi:hypothetical protein
MAKITYLNKELYNRVRKDADKKFSKDSYVKNIWVLKEYERRGGKTKKSGEKPKNEKIKKQVTGSWELDFDLDTFEVASEDDEFEQDYEDYCREFGIEIETFETIEAKDNQEKIDEVYSKYHATTNMGYSALKKWSENPCSKAASLSRGPINRNLKLLSKKKSEWTMADVKSANRTISFISRMKGAEQGEKTKVKKDGKEISCPSKRDVSLRNWAYNP